MFGRAPTVVASAGLHLSVIASFAGGHVVAARGDAPAPVIELVVDTTRDAPSDRPAIEPNVPARARPHQHAYPVPPSHDLHPHDPSLVHTPASLPVRSAAEAAPMVDPVEPLAPTFTIALGSSSPPARAPGNVGPGLSDDAGADEAVPEAGVAIRARLLSSSLAVYPPRARAAEVEADVPVEIVVDRAGLVSEAKVLHRAGYGFDEAAVAAVRRYHFSPAQRAGRAVRVRMSWVVQFRLDG